MQRDLSGVIYGVFYCVFEGGHPEARSQPRRDPHTQTHLTEAFQRHEPRITFFRAAGLLGLIGSLACGSLALNKPATLANQDIERTIMSQQVLFISCTSFFLRKMKRLRARQAVANALGAASPLREAQGRRVALLEGRSSGEV